jgi:hypothetical protein
MAERVDQVAGRGEVPNGFCDAGLAQREPVAGRAAVSDPAIGGPMVLRRAQFRDGDEPAMLFVRFANLVLPYPKQPGLDAVPQFADGGASVRVCQASSLLSEWISFALNRQVPRILCFITHYAASIYNYFTKIKKSGG